MELPGKDVTIICNHLNVNAKAKQIADGLEALRTFDEFQPDWTILDIAMPGLDGLTVTRRILGAHPGARIAVITHHPGPEFEQAAREAGAHSFIRKDNLQPLLALLSNGQQLPLL